jgi:hypothetical protein
MEGTGLHVIEVDCCISLEGLSTTVRTSIKVAGVLAEICTSHLPNTSLEHYHCTNLSNLFGLSIISITL